MGASPDGYEIVPYADRYRQDVLRLRSGFRAISDAWNEQHFRWQQEECPWFEAHQAALALYEGRVVGMRVLQPAEWEAGTPAVRFKGPCYAGTVIEEGHRSKGLMSRLTRAVEEQARRGGARFALNLNAGPVTHMGALAEGWRRLGAFGPVIRPAAIEGFDPGRRVLRGARRALAVVLPAPGAGVKISGRLRPDEMAELAASGGNDGRLRHVKDARWFRWRYADPSSRYLFVYFERERRLVGYMALHRAAPPLPGGPLNLVDWERSDRLDWSEMLRVVTRVADRRVLPVTTWSAALPPDERERLPDLGFVPRPPSGALARQRPTFLVGRIEPSEPAEAVGSTRDRSDDDGDWTVGGRRVDRVDEWDLRPIFADPY